MRKRSKVALVLAGGGITGGQNGLAIAGDFMSAATLLGMTAIAWTVTVLISQAGLRLGWGGF